MVCITGPSATTTPSTGGKHTVRHLFYVGKADPKKFGNSLFSRLGQHRKSIAASSNLNVEDFQCRYIIVDDVWIPFGEQLLIDMFKPIWNEQIRGFGSNPLGKERITQTPSNWDLLHPGRQRSTNPTNAAALAVLEVKLKKYLEALGDEN